MSQVHEAVEKALAASKSDECIVIGQESSTANLRWANNTVTTNGVTSDNEILVISVKDKRVGSIGRNFFPEERIEDLVRESEDACDGKPQAEDYMPLLEGDAKANDWDAPVSQTGIEALDGLTSSLGPMLRKADTSDTKLFGYAEHRMVTTYLATSTGVRRRYDHQQGQVELNAKSPDFGRSVWTGQTTKDFSDVDLDTHFERLQQKMKWSEKTISLEPGQYEVLLEPSAVADMLLYAYWTSSARDADEGRSVFSAPGGGNRIGERMYADSVNIYSDAMEKGYEVAPFLVMPQSTSYFSLFDNGLESGRVDWVKDGTQNALITTRYWAEKTKGKPTPYVQNLIFPGDGPSLDDMISSTERALLVTCFWYIRVVDPQTLLLTGLTRDGVFLVEGGEVKGAVNNFRYNESPVDMLASVTEVGRSESTLAREFGDYFTFIQTPPLRVEKFNMSSVSQAT